jgi:hypothetical protein
MAYLTADSWLVDLEKAIADHITTCMATKLKTVKVRIGETELPRPLNNPHITVQTSDDIPSHIGGMDIVSSTQQGEKHDQRFYILIFTDKDTGGQKERGVLSSILTTYVFGAERHTLLDTINGIELTYMFDGNAIDSSVSDDTQYVAQYLITITVIVPYTATISL